MSRIAFLTFILLVFFMNQANVMAADSVQLPLKSEAAVLLDSETNAILYAKNPDKRMFPASVTKIATAIYAIEKGDLNSVATVSKNAASQEGTRVYLVEGEKVPLKKLIQGMLINSGNDAAVAIAEHIDGSVEEFSKNINVYLNTEIGVKNTHFTNPNGLHDDNHYTTAMDLALITNYAIKNPVFAEIFGTKVLNWTGQSWSTTLYTHHRMLKGELPYKGITGGKTGYTTVSKQTMATTADNGQLRLTAIVLKSNLKNDKYKDTAVLLDYGFKEYQHETLGEAQTFQVAQYQYTPEKDLLITEPITGSIKKVSNTGVLTIENSAGQVIQTVQLKKVVPETEKKVVTKVDKPLKAAEEQQTFHTNALYGTILLVLAIAVAGIRKKFFYKQQ